MFAAQTRLRSILSGRFTFKFGSFNWIRFMITSLCPFTYCTYNPEKVSRYYEKNKKKRTVLCGMLSLSYISSQIRYSCTLSYIIWIVVGGGIIKPKRIFYLDFIHSNSDFSPIPVIRTICIARVMATYRSER